MSSGNGNTPNRPNRPIRSARFSRRNLLRGLGAGAALFGPFLKYRSSMAQAASAAPAGNLLIFYTPNGHLRSLTNNGVTTTQFDGTGSASSLTLGASLTPLQPFVNDVAITKGLCLKTPTFIASHQDICRILTGVSAPKEGNDNSQFTGYGPSIDQSVGIAINQTPLVVAVDPYRDQPQWRTFLSWRSASVNEPFTKDHQSAFMDLFGNLTGQTTSADQMAALVRAQARNKSLLDFVKGDIATFSSRINSNDKAHMDAYLDAIQTVEQKVTTMATVPGTCSTSSLQTRISGLPTAPVQNDDKSPPGVVDQMQTRGELWMDMIAASFACGTRRVAVIQWQGASEGYDVGNNSGSPDHHSVSHYSFGAASGNRWVAIDTWYAQRFAYQLNALKTLGVLDKTVVVWVSEITQGHNQLNMVVPIAGGQALGMKMGQYVQFPFKGNEVEGSAAIPVGQDPANTGLNDLWATVQQAVGVNQTTFGDAKWNTGPLSQIWTKQ